MYQKIKNDKICENFHRLPLINILLTKGGIEVNFSTVKEVEDMVTMIT